LAESVTPEGVVASVAQEKPRVLTEELPPEALKQRLEREAEKGRREGRTAWLAENGFADEASAKKALEELAAKREAQKSAEERHAQLAEQHKKVAARATLAETVIAERLERELSSLTKEQREAVAKLSGDDKVAALRAIDALAATWAKPEQKPEEKPIEKKPSATAPSRNAAPKDNMESPPDHKAVWEDLQRTNPFKAGDYLRQHRDAIFPSDR
jgi:hypothetical protein